MLSFVLGSTNLFERLWYTTRLRDRSFGMLQVSEVRWGFMQPRKNRLRCSVCINCQQNIVLKCCQLQAQLQSETRLLQDIESIDALAEAIGEYDGGVIIVS